MSHITAYKCTQCETIMYPRHYRCVNCGGREFKEITPTDKCRLLTYTILNELPWGIDEYGRVIGIVEFTNGIKAMSLIEAPEVQVKSGMKLASNWKDVCVIQGEGVYGLSCQPAK